MDRDIRRAAAHEGDLTLAPKRCARLGNGRLGDVQASSVVDVMGKIACLLPIVLVAGVAAAPASAGGPAPEFTPRNGFAGESEGRGSLKLMLGKARPFHVSSRGSEQNDGTFRLDQTVTFQGEAPKQRFWILSTTSPHHYSATLSDAAGPVTGTTTGPRLSFHYRVKGPLVMHQVLRLLPDRKTIDNVGVITFIGIPVGRLHETITRTVPVSQQTSR